MTDNLGEIFAEARQYGLVDLVTLDGGTYCCSILIDLEDREVKAKSGFQHMTPYSAIKAAIQVAAGILRSAVTDHMTANRGQSAVVEKVLAFAE